jgi:hypothetical protein
LVGLHSSLCKWVAYRLQKCCSIKFLSIIDQFCGNSALQRYAPVSLGFCGIIYLDCIIYWNIYMLTLNVLKVIDHKIEIREETKTQYISAY